MNNMQNLVAKSSESSEEVRQINKLHQGYDNDSNNGLYQALRECGGGDRGRGEIISAGERTKGKVVQQGSLKGVSAGWT